MERRNFLKACGAAVAGLAAGVGGLLDAKPKPVGFPFIDRPCRAPGCPEGPADGTVWYRSDECRFYRMENGHKVEFFPPVKARSEAERIAREASFLAYRHL